MIYVGTKYKLSCFNDGKKNPDKFQEYNDGKTAFGEYRAFTIWLDTPKKIRSPKAERTKPENVYRQYIKVYIFGEKARTLNVGDEIEIRKIIYVKRMNMQTFIGILIEDEEDKYEY